MILRKINAGLSLVTTVLFLNHASLSIWMLYRCGIEKKRHQHAKSFDGSNGPSCRAYHITCYSWTQRCRKTQMQRIPTTERFNHCATRHWYWNAFVTGITHCRCGNAFSAKNTSFNYASCILCSVIFAHCSFCKQGNNYLRNRKRLLGKTRFYPARRHQLSQHYTSGTCKN